MTPEAQHIENLITSFIKEAKAVLAQDPGTLTNLSCWEKLNRFVEGVKAVKSSDREYSAALGAMGFPRKSKQP